MTNEELRNIETEYIRELNMLLDSYRFEDRILLGFLRLFCFGVAVGIYWVMCSLLGMILSSIFTLILLFLELFAIKKFGVSFSNAPLEKEDIAERVCQLMEFLVEIKKGTYTSYGGVAILTEQAGKHLILYKEFITLYPQFESKKLKSLAKFDIKSKYYT